MNCESCGVEMKALATSLYCPNDCDRVAEGAPRYRCHKCGSEETEPFLNCIFGDWHCLPCGTYGSSETS